MSAAIYFGFGASFCDKKTPKFGVFFDSGKTPSQKTFLSGLGTRKELTLFSLFGCLEAGFSQHPMWEKSLDPNFLQQTQGPKCRFY